MDRQANIRQLGAELAAAGTARDWTRLEAAARALGPRLSALAARGRWSAAEHAALAQLRATHEEAAAASAGAAQALAIRLEEMRTNKDGWIAYSLECESVRAGNP